MYATSPHCSFPSHICVDPEAIYNFTRQLFNEPAPEESEDCLTVNVFSSAGATGQAVLVYLYGGSLDFGGNAIQRYDGSSFAANQEVVIVVPNYRTNGMQSTHFKA